MDLYFVAFRVLCASAVEQSPLNNLFNLIVIVRIIVLINCTCSISYSILEILDLFVSWPHVVGTVQLFEIESFEYESAIEMLTFKLNCCLLEEVVAVRVGSSHLKVGHEINTLWNSLEPACLRFLRPCCSRSGSEINSRNESYPDFVLVRLFNECNIVFVWAAVFYSYPLILSNFVAFCLINLIDNRHFLGWHKLD